MLHPYLYIFLLCTISLSYHVTITRAPFLVPQLLAHVYSCPRPPPPHPTHLPLCLLLLLLSLNFHLCLYALGPPVCLIFSAVRGSCMQGGKPAEQSLIIHLAIDLGVSNLQATIYKHHATRNLSGAQRPPRPANPTPSLSNYCKENPKN